MQGTVRAAYITDLGDPDAVIHAFETVRSEFGHPHVVIYNVPNDPNNVFEVPLGSFKTSRTINIFSTYAAAQEAVKDWKDFLAPSSPTPTYIYTGNIRNEMRIPSLMSLEVRKTAAAWFNEVASTSYKDQGFKFYYADERKADGTPMYSGATPKGHAQFDVDLAEGQEQEAWQQTFVSGQGYKKF
ncbi:short-chain dehydrogenase [Fusarium mundagurra]|uniref:Short-chain dehydrogenase n=1 Tax=Fusarium mundagurra TaxID=1567541 RepID=A0A8H6D2W4_9HYPO|nr:short-chain dehydrogenase [Fusarium mundagurra]